MNTAALEQALEAALAPRALLTHPFYQAWSAGELRADDLARYAEQYRFQVHALPELLRRARALTPDGETVAELSRNLDDEEGRTGVAHARLWEQRRRRRPCPRPARRPSRSRGWSARTR